MKAKAQETLPSHFRITDEAGNTEDFTLGIRQYISDGEAHQKTLAKIGESEDLWLALDSDKFYLDDDENGEEIWPITFEAVHISDASRTLSVTFDKEGFVSAKEPGTNKARVISEPSLMFLEAVPILEEPCDDPSVIIDCDDGGGGGGGTGGGGTGGRVNDWSRGPSTGTFQSNSTYFVIKSMRLAATGDGSGASELQMFVKKDDNYQNNMPISYKYRFDKVVRSNPYLPLSNNTMIQGADKGGYDDYYYQVPDINNKGQDYNFNIVRYRKFFNGTYLTDNVDFFPLFNLTQTGGPWRLVLSDDDKDYADFSQRRSSSYARNIQTFYMDDGIWRSVYTGFTTRSHLFGSGDDPIAESGVRRINEFNVNKRISNGYAFSTVKWYGSDSFRYTFGLKTY